MNLVSTYLAAMQIQEEIEKRPCSLRQFARLIKQHDLHLHNVWDPLEKPLMQNPHSAIQLCPWVFCTLTPGQVARAYQDAMDLAQTRPVLDKLYHTAAHLPDAYTYKPRQSKKPRIRTGATFWINDAAAFYGGLQILRSYQGRCMMQQLMQQPFWFWSGTVRQLGTILLPYMIAEGIENMTANRISMAIELLMDK